MDEHLDPGRETSISERGLKLLAKLKVDNCFDNLGAFMEAPRSRYRCGMALFRANLRPGQAVSVWSGTSIIGRSCAVCSAWYTLVVSSMRRWGFSIRLRGASTRPQSSTADLDKDRNTVGGGVLWRQHNDMEGHSKAARGHTTKSCTVESKAWARLGRNRLERELDHRPPSL